MDADRARIEELAESARRLPVAERRRVLDFATGVVFGLGGRLQRIDALRFVGVPEHVDIPASRLPSLVDATADVA